MPIFAWEARTSAGEIRGGELAGADETQVIEALRRRGLRVTRVVPSPRRRSRRAGEAAAAALAPALRQLLTLRAAGVKAAEALELTARGSRGEVARALHAAQLAVESGAGLGEALAQHPTSLGALAARSLGEADRRGLLDPTLAALLELLTRAAATRSAARAAFTRAARATATLLGLAALVSLVLVPAGVAAHARLGVAATGLSSAAQAAASWLALGTASLALLLMLAALAAAVSSPLRARLSALAAGLAEVLRRLALARFARGLAVLTTAEAPRQLALELAAWEADDPELGEAAQRARAGVARGDDLGVALAEAGMPPAFARAVQAAERGGDLPGALRRLAELEEDAALTWLDARSRRLARGLDAVALLLLVAATAALAHPLLP